MKRYFGATSALVLVALPLLLCCGGCGGGASYPNGGASVSANAVAIGTGRATFHIAWPSVAPSRLIPEASESIEIRVMDGAKIVKSVVVRRGQSEVTIEELPAKKLLNVLRAFPNADASGVVQAEGSAEVEIKPDENAEIALTLASTVANVRLTAEGGGVIDASEKVALTVSPRSAADEVVLVRPSGFRYVSLSPDVATVDAAGLVTGQQGGAAIIEVTEIESGKTARYTVVVSPTGRFVFTNVTGNATATDLVPDGSDVDEDEYLDPNGTPIPNISFFAYKITGRPQTAEYLSRSVDVVLPPNFAVGDTQDVTASASNPWHVTVNETRFANGEDKERFFLSTGGGTVTFVRREGNRYTLRYTNVVLEAFDALNSDATGRCTLNGTVTYTDRDPSD